MRTLGVLAGLLLFAAALWLPARRGPEAPAWRPGPPALGPADLASGKVDRSSFSGSHSYLHTGGREPGLARLMWRQFSDWKPAPGAGGGENPLFAPVLALDEKDLGARSVAEYQWRPDVVRYRTEYAGGLTASTAAGYLGVDTLFAQVDLTNRGAAPRRVAFAGAVSPHAKASFSGASDPGHLAIRIEAAPPNEWGAPPTPLVRTFQLRASLGTARATGERAYEVAFDLPPGATQSFAVTFTDGSDADAVRAFWTAPRAPPARAADAVADWFRQANVPDTARANPRTLRMAYNAWFNFWYNTEHPEGLWKNAIITPSRSSYGRGVWLWDSAFHVMALVRGGPRAVDLARDQVLALVRSAHPDGHLPREVWVGVANPEIQAPGILTWAALDVYGRTGDKGFLHEVYPVLASNDRWYYQHRDDNHNDLAEWYGGDSGWDTSPRWDAAKEGNRTLAVDAVDLNCWLKLDQDRLAEMAGILGLRDAERDWKARALRTAAAIRAKMWNEADGFYYDLHPKTGEMIRVKTPHTYWTLLARVATYEQAERMVGHLSDPAVFGTPWPLPCVAKGDKAFNPSDYWRGPVWVNLNWLTVLGLENYGYAAEARRLRKRTLELILNDPTPREYYNPLTGAGLGAHNYMWTGALYLVMLGEEAR